MSGSGVLAGTQALLEEGLARNRERGVQLYVARAGAPVAHIALGESREGVPMRTDTLVFWISMTKPVMGVAFGQLVDAGLVGWDDPVARYVPEFGTCGKQDVTLRHVLTHTGGFRNAWSRWYPSPPFWEVVETICAAEQEEGWEPGRMSGYNVAAGWYMLGAVLERIVGSPFSDYARAEIFAPLGMNDCWVAMPTDVYAGYGDRVAVTPHLEDDEWKTDPAWSTAEGAAILRPGGNGYGPLDQLARLYEMLLGEGERAGVRLLEPATAAAIKARQTRGLEDKTFGFMLDRGFGTVINTSASDPRFNWYGQHASPDTFGHAGYFSSVAFADPKCDLVVALAFNGVREDLEHFVRSTQTLDAIYADLGLASP